MFRTLMAAGVAALAMASALPVSAAVIADTGEPNLPTLGGISSSIWLATSFNLSQQTRITDVRAWLGLGDFGGEPPPLHPLTFAIRGTANGTAGATTLYSGQINIAVDTPYQWRGLSGLEWDLGPGTYWLALEQRAFDLGDVAGEVGWVTAGPGATYAEARSEIDENGNPTGLPSGYGNSVRGEGFAYQIEGYALTVGGGVPEPATWALMITGFGLAGGTLRRRRAYA